MEDLLTGYNVLSGRVPALRLWWCKPYAVLSLLATTANGAGLGMVCRTCDMRIATFPLVQNSLPKGMPWKNAWWMGCKSGARQNECRPRGEGDRYMSKYKYVCICVYIYLFFFLLLVGVLVCCHIAWWSFAHTAICLCEQCESHLDANRWTSYAYLLSSCCDYAHHYHILRGSLRLLRSLLSTFPIAAFSLWPWAIPCLLYGVIPRRVDLLIFVLDSFSLRCPLPAQVLWSWGGFSLSFLASESFSFLLWSLHPSFGALSQAWQN